MIVKSPITQSTNTRFLKTYDPSIMSDNRITERRVDNYLCLDTGLVFNALGARGSEKIFYTDEYDLHSENEDSEFKYFESKEAVGIYDEIVELITRSITLNSNPSILDVGCGKGLLLKKLQKKYPNSHLYGVEPSRNALKFFHRFFPDVKIFEGVFEDSPFLDKKFNLVVSNGVLEHVPNPVDFLKKIRRCIAEDGFLYIGVPNFKNNPADLFTYDHLSRFTPDSINVAFQLAGFEIVASKVSDQRVPMWYILKSVGEKNLSDLKIDIHKSSVVVEKSLRDIEAFFKSYQQAANDAKRKKKKIAVYGTGTLGLIGMRYTNMDLNIIECFFDDNMSIWGSKRNGIPVNDPKKLTKTESISEIVIAANPCYLDLIENKVSSLIEGTTLKLHLPQI
jgi:SAM-dependent methyltransferase